VERQGVQISEWVKERGFDLSKEVKHAMAAHNASNTGVQPESKMDWALFCGDSLTGLIVAGALVLPSKKLADLTVESVLKRFKEPSFARGTRREDIKICEKELGIPLEGFVRIALTAMQGISGNLGL
jgi:predicted hydrolase (HD superfamily)